MRSLKAVLAMLAGTLLCNNSALAESSRFHKAWADEQRALIIDGYEHNEFDLTLIARDKRVAGFIHKGSDGLAPAYRCTGLAMAKKICRQRWQRHIVAKELYHTRRQLAKALGLKWGVYHLGRPNNPIEQAQHFIRYADPQDDELVVLDIEDNDPDKWMSLEDAERFVQYIHNRLGRWPMLYTNGNTAKFIADHRDDYPILSRLPLWYARYKPSIKTHFPKGNWESYDIWQFASQINCKHRRCPYRVQGTNRDIDVNVVDMTVEELRAAWPFDQLVDRIPNESEKQLIAAQRNGTMPNPARRPGTTIQTPAAVLIAAYRQAWEMRQPRQLIDGQTTASVAASPMMSAYEPQF